MYFKQFPISENTTASIYSSEFAKVSNKRIPSKRLARNINQAKSKLTTRQAGVKSRHEKAEKGNTSEENELILDILDVSNLVAKVQHS
jgi:hypothetical protein